MNGIRGATARRRLGRAVGLGLVAVALAAGRLPFADATEPFVRWDAPIEVASGAADRGPWRMNHSVFDFVDDPTVAIDARGEVAIVWADHSRKDLFFQRYGADGTAQLGAPVNVSRSPHIFSWLPRLAVPADDPTTVYVLWQEIVFSGGSHGGEIYFARSRDGGRSFGDSVNLSNSPAGAGKGRLTANSWDNGSLDLVVDSKGRLHAAWTEYEGRLWYRQSVDGGASFSPARLVAGQESARPARGPSLAVDDRGVVHLAWTVGEDPAADIRVATGDDGRTFGEPRIVAPGRGHADAPSLAVDGRRTVHLVYAENAGGRAGPSRVRYSRRAADADAFEEPRTISAPPGAASAGAGFPTLSVDGDGRLHAVWELFPDRGPRSRGLGYTTSADHGATFAAASTVPGTGDPRDGFNGSQQGLLMRKLAVRREGAIAVVNSTFRTNEASRIRLLRGQAGGR